MTNGEKLQETFPNAEISYGLRGVVAVTFIHKTIFDLDWWNAEYQEPSSSEIPTGSDDCISKADAIHAVSEALKRTFVEHEDVANKIIGKLPSVTPIKPKGYWIEHQHEAGANWEYSRYECSECHNWAEDDSNYCPCCGIEMDGVNSVKRF